MTINKLPVRTIAILAATILVGCSGKADNTPKMQENYSTSETIETQKSASVYKTSKIQESCSTNKISETETQEISFADETQENTFTDSRDGKKYRTVRIGEQTWMAENLNYQTDRSWCYKDDSSNCDKYGRLYDWNTAMKACPKGWRLPSREDWDILGQAVGGTRDDDGNWIGAGTKLKSKTGWEDWFFESEGISGSGNGTDDYGFSALPGQSRHTGSYSNFVGMMGYWWTSESRDDTSYRDGAYYRGMLYNTDFMYERSTVPKSFGFSVRCLKD